MINIYQKKLSNIRNLDVIKNEEKKSKPVIWLTTILTKHKDFLQKIKRKAYRNITSH